MLCFFEFGILVTAPLQDLIDIHACAKYKSDQFGEFGAWHCVIDINLAEEMQRLNIVADGSNAVVIKKTVVECFSERH